MMFSERRKSVLKKTKRDMLLFLIGILLIFPSLVNADSYTTAKGLELSEEEYNNFSLIYPDTFIENMSEEHYNRISSMNIDFSTATKIIKYYKTDYNNVTGEVINTEVTETEYNNATPASQDRSLVYETSYKKLVLSLSKTTTASAYASVDLFWKIMPSVRSFDVIGMRLSNLSVINGTQSGFQFYTSGGTQQSVYYHFNGTNINNLYNGFGISMNLVDASVTFLECFVDANLSIDGYPASVYGSYQHATSNITLAKSQSYTLGAGGLGSVFIFNPASYYNYFDQMPGLYTGFAS